MDGADKIIRICVSRPRLMALACGLLVTLGMPPLKLWPLALLGLAGLVWLITNAPGVRQAALRGWLFGAAHFTLTNNWIAGAFAYQDEMPHWLGWIAVPVMALGLAIFPALACAGARWLCGARRDPGQTGLALAGVWVICEWLRAWLFTGYAWGPLGLILLGPWDRPGIARMLPWFGTYALSAVALLLAVSLLLLVLKRRWLSTAALAVLATAVMYAPAGPPRQGTLALTLVQPNLAQDELNDPSKFEAQFQQIMRLSRQRREVARRLVLWPESGVPDYLRDGYPQRYYDQMTAGGDPHFARWRIGRTIGAGNLLLTGAVDLEIEDGYAVGARNGVTAIDGMGTIRAGYDKAHLVPFGEYLPLRWLLEPLGAKRLVAGTIDFHPGPGPRSLKLGQFGTAGIQICYEIVFSGEIVDPHNRPDYIFNPSNDGWFGWWGPPQHLAQARLRAIEEGLPILRSMTTGISGVIDARGVVRHTIGMGRAARIDTFVPPAAPPTLFSRLGNTLPLIWAAILLALSLVASRRRAS